MKKRHDDEEGEHENGERWLLTYSDLITLLLALFIIMYTMSTIDMVKMQKLSETLNEAFNGNKEFNGTLETPTEKSVSDYKKAADAADAEAAKSEASQAVTDESGSLDQIYKELKKYIEENKLEDKIELKNTDTYIKISLKDMFLFVPDSSVMLPQSKPVLAKIESALNSLYKKIDHITITGHTADPANDKNNSSALAWQLSTERAVTVLNYLASQGLPQYKLSIAGYSHFEPVAVNTTEAGRAKNRRVEITIFKTLPAGTGTSTGTTTTKTTEGTASSSTTKTESTAK